MLRIWFNRTYATNVHTIAQLRDNPDGLQIRVIGTHVDMSSPVLAGCDVAEQEPTETLNADEYVDWALDFCSRHGVDVLIPRLHLVAIAAAHEKFAAAGVAVVAGPPGPAAMLEDKAAAYDEARTAGLDVPPFRVVTTGRGLVEAFNDLRGEVGEVCLKPVTGVGGEGFRVLTAEYPSLSDVVGKLTPRVNVEHVATAIDAHSDSGQTVPPLMVMPFLSGPEVSVDCLGDECGSLLAAVPRVKFARRRRLAHDPDAVSVARAIVARHRLSSLSNTQVRYWQHPGKDSAPRPYLLETNARISGGLYQTALTGVNLPWAAVMQALGRPMHLPEPALGLSYATVSTVVPLSEEHNIA